MQGVCVTIKTPELQKTIDVRAVAFIWQDFIMGKPRRTKNLMGQHESDFEFGKRNIFSILQAFLA